MPLSRTSRDHNILITLRVSSERIRGPASGNHLHTIQSVIVASCKCLFLITMCPDFHLLSIYQRWRENPPPSHHHHQRRRTGAWPSPASTRQPHTERSRLFTDNRLFIVVLPVCYIFRSLRRLLLSLARPHRPRCVKGGALGWGGVPEVSAIKRGSVGEGRAGWGVGGGGLTAAGSSSHMLFN